MEYRVKVQSQIEDEKGNKKVIVNEYIEHSKTRREAEETAIKKFCNSVFPYWR